MCPGVWCIAAAGSWTGGRHGLWITLVRWPLPAEIPIEEFQLVSPGEISATNATGGAVSSAPRWQGARTSCENPIPVSDALDAGRRLKKERIVRWCSANLTSQLHEMNSGTNNLIGAQWLDANLISCGKSPRCFAPNLNEYPHPYKAITVQ